MTQMIPNLATEVPPSSTHPANVALGTVKFDADSSFYRELCKRVDHYFHQSGRKQRDCPQMYVKTAIVLGWFLASYLLLVFGTTTWWLAVPFAISLALSMAAIGFNIQHDGGHGAYSERRWINKLMALTLDLLGGSSYAWARKHNVIHHSYSNITGHDNDINLGFLGRLSPHQKWLTFHRLQHIYLWALYGLLPIKWQVYDDFRAIVTGRIGEHRLARPKGWDLACFIGGKLLFFSLALGIPMLFHSVPVVIAFYVAVMFIQGIVLSVVFQLSHCVEQASFPLPQEGRMETPWAVHQVETTVNYAPGNRLLNWFVGGLNFQIEHHLFPRICHIHYAAIAPLVESTCSEFGIRYQVNKTLGSALASHFRWLRRMGTACEG